MAVFYTGTRPVLKGRSSADMVHPYKGVGKYSNWAIYSASHVLDGAPNSNHTPGTGRHPGDIFMSQLFTGSVSYKHPLTGAGDSFNEEFRPYEYKGLSGAAVFKSGYGHEDRVTSYSHHPAYLFFGIAAAQQLKNYGHTIRTDDTGAPASFGHFAPHIFKGVDKAFDSGYGQTYPTGYNNAYGKNRVNEYRGVPSAKILK